MTRLLPITLLLLIPAWAVAAEREARSRVCAEDLPEGAHVSALLSCARPPAPRPRRDGFYDFGNGTTLRIGGRASAQYGVSR